MWNLQCQDVCARVWLVISSLHTIVQMEDLRYILYQPLLTFLKLQKGYRQVKPLFSRFFFPTHASFIASLKNHTAVFPMACLLRFTFHKPLCHELTLLIYCFHVSFEQPSLGAQWLQLKSRLRKLAGQKKTIGNVTGSDYNNLSLQGKTELILFGFFFTCFSLILYVCKHLRYLCNICFWSLIFIQNGMWPSDVTHTWDLCMEVGYK